MAKKVKFPLDMGNDVKVRSIEELKENYNAEKVTEYFLNGKLLTWLEDRYYDEEAEQVRELAEQSGNGSPAAKLGAIFGIETEEEIDVEALEIRREKLEKLRKITADDEIIKNVDFVAFSQEELGDLLDEEAQVIYLCGESFRIPLSVKNVRYVGVNNPIVTVSSKGDIDLEANGITIEHCEFSEDTKARLVGKLSEKDEEIPYTSEEDFEFEVEGGWVCLCAYNGSDSIIRIPEIVNEIDSYAFTDCEKLTSVIIPDGVTEIGEEAFSGCSNLLSVNIPKSLTVIEDGTFIDCEKLETINIPEGVTKIGEYAFSGCKKLRKIDIPNSVTEICEAAFFECDSLESVVIPYGVKKIEDSVFMWCENLTRVHIPNSVTEIAGAAFSLANNLRVTIPDSVIKVDKMAFSDSKSIQIRYRGKTYDGEKFRKILDKYGDSLKEAIAKYDGSYNDDDNYVDYSHLAPDDDIY